jgi:hypothetical protein
MLQSAGFTSIREHDVTPEFLRIAQAWVAANQRHARAMRAWQGAVDFEQSVAEPRDGVAAIEAGLRRRMIYVATRPMR